MSAIDKATGKEQHITIENKGSLTQDEIERIKADAEAHKAEDEQKRVELEKLNKASSLRYTTETTMETYKEKPELMSEDDKKFFTEKLDELKKMEDSKDFTNLDSVEKELSSKWNAIAMKAYGGNNPIGENPIDDMMKYGFSADSNNTADTEPNNDGSKNDFEEV